MTDETVFGGDKPSLGELVHCANCGAAMANTGQIYYCPNAVGHSGRDCPTNPVGTSLLTRKVFAGLMERFATEDTISYLTRVIKATTEPRADVLRQRLDATEAALAQSNAQDPTALQTTETRTKRYPDTAAELGALDQLAATRARQSMIVRDELDKLDFIGDEPGIRNDATNPTIMLEGNGAEEAQEFLDLLVNKVLVDSTSATIVYEAPMPTNQPWETVTEDRVDLYQFR